MRIFWLFRSNIKNLEYYHYIENLETFENVCHDFYMLFPIWLLRNNFFDSVVVWRLSKKPPKEINFNVDEKIYSQRWVRDFSEVFKYPKPEISLFRGGFPEYDRVVSQNPKHFGLKLYLGTGKRIYPQYGGKYDIYLQEDEKDFRDNMKCLPFYKTASPKIFFPDSTLSSPNFNIDICWPCNFAQIKHKGQETFIREVSKSDFLRSLTIYHCGNKQNVGKRMCKKYDVNNIRFVGQVDRQKLNKILNMSKFGLCMSNRVDGCPRVVTEIMMSGTPLIVRDLTRLLSYYKKNGVIEITEKNLAKKIKVAFDRHDDYKRQIEYSIRNLISFDKICAKNIHRWQKI